MSVEFKRLSLKILSLGEFELKLHRVTNPKTIDRLWQILPVSGRAIKQGARLILPTSVKTSKEKVKTEFSKGDISIEASSGNLSLYLEKTVLQTGENYIGTIHEDFSVDNMPITSTVIIKALE